MGQSAEELRRDIERTREGLGETLDAIGDRVSPGRIIERKKNRVSYGIRSARERVMGTVSDTGHALSDRVSGGVHTVGDGATGALDTVKGVPGAVTQQAQGAPVVAGAIAFGIGFLVAAAFPASQAERDAGAKVLEKVEPLKGELVSAGKEMAEHLKEPAMDAANQVKDAATQSAQSVTETAKSAAQDTADQAKSATESVKSDAQQAAASTSSSGGAGSTGTASSGSTGTPIYGETPIPGDSGSTTSF